MIIVDTELQRRAAANTPIRVGMIGAGFMARGVALQLIKYVPGFHLVGISNRQVDGAKRAYTEAGITAVSTVENVADLEQAIKKNQHCVTDDPLLLCKAEGIDVILEVTGTIEFGATVALCAIENRKHFVAMNAELDSTLGPILNHRAQQAGVVFTNVDGDQPGVILNLYRFVKGMGVKPVLCGNIKGLQDPYRNPTTQKGFAEKWKQNPVMVTSFADGSKISFEQAIVANATGMKVGKRGMFGPTVETGTDINEAPSWYPEAALQSDSGIVDYVVGAHPGPGVFVLGTHSDPAQQHYLNLYKLGEGPYYCFYTPYHLCHFEVHNTLARAVLFSDAAIAPIGKPMVDVITTAKIDLNKGATLDGIGEYMTYGECENSETVFAEQLLPLGLAAGCTLKNDIPKDGVIRYEDVILPENRLGDRLRKEQETHFFGA